MKNFKLTADVNNNIIHLMYETQYDMCSSFVRMQEFYESPYPEINNKYFTLEDFMDRYAEDKGNFTYFTDWGGFNIPGNVVNTFRYIYAGNLSAKEQLIMNIINFSNPEKNNYYLIATDKGTFEKEALEHELSHAYYYLDNEYNKRIYDLINLLPVSTYDAIQEKLSGLGYGEESLDDEIQAYLATMRPVELHTFFGLERKNWNTPLIKEFKNIFKERNKK